MSAEECRGTDWFRRGYGDGDAGLQPWDALYQHQCEKHGVTVDVPAYRTGWQDGRWEFERRTSFGGSMDGE